MNRFRLFLSMILMGIGTLAIGQSKGDLLKAIGAGDLDQISTYIGESVEICIQDDQNSYDKKEGLDILQSFFSQHKAKGFTKKHGGVNKKSSSTYTIGELSTDQGPFRVFVYTDEADGKLTLEELRITTE